MTSTEPQAKAPRTATGIFLMLLALALLIPAAATADGRIGSTSSFLSGTAPGGLFSPIGVAVSRGENGDLYVLDTQFDRVSEFEPDGTFLRAFGWGIVPGAATGTGDLTAGSTSVTNVTTTSGVFSHSGAGGKIITGPGILPGTKIERVTSTELKLTKGPIESHPGATLSVAAGPGNVPVNEVQKLTVKAGAGQFKLTFISPKPGTATLTTSTLSYNVSPEELEAALAGLANIGTGNVSVSGGPGDAAGSAPYLIEFKGKYADVNVRRLSVAESTLSGGVPSTEAAITTPTEGGGVLETCTTACGLPSAEESTSESGQTFGGARPGQLDLSDEIAIDNSCAEHKPPLTELTTPTCAEFDPSYGDVYVVDQKNFRIEKFDPSEPEVKFELMFGGGVDKGPHHPGNLCTAEYLAEGDSCAAGTPGTGPAHFYKEEPETEAGHRKTWNALGSNSIAVGPDGRVYVGDYGRVQEFEPDGSFAGEFKPPVEPGEEPQFVAALAIDAAGDLFERSYVSDGPVFSEVPGVREFDPSHTTLLHTFDAEPGSKPTHISLDAAGDLFLSDYGNGPEPPATCDSVDNTQCPKETFLAYKPDGALVAEFSSEQVKVDSHRPTSAGVPPSIAVGDAAGQLLVPGRELVRGQSAEENQDIHYIATIPLPAAGAPLVEEESVTDLEPNRATLHAVVNPREFKTESRFQYISDADFQADGEQFGPGTEETPRKDLGLVFRRDHLQAPLEDLAPSTLYHFRAVAESECNGLVPPAEPCLVTGADETFETTPAVVINGLATQTVGPELVTLKAELNPQNSLAAGEYTISYGAGPGYECEAGNTCSSSGPLAAHSHEFEAVTATFTGLKPHTTYHYQLIAHNDFGTAKSADATFTTEPSAAEEHAAELAECPNVNLRENGDSTALPDCRAYEQVSAHDKHGGEALPANSLAPGGERLLYDSEGVVAGASVNEGTISYLAQRTPAGWVTQPTLAHLAPPGTEPATNSNERVFSPELDRWLFAEVPGFAHLTSFYYAPWSYLSMGSADGSYLLHASPTFEPLEGEPRQYYEYLTFDSYKNSEDLSHLYVVTDARLLAGDPRPDGFEALSFKNPAGEADRIYEISGVGGPSPAIQLIAELPLGLRTYQDGGTPDGCAIDEGAAEWNQNQTSRFASADGSTFVYSNAIENVPSPGGEVHGRFCGPGTPNPVVLFAHHTGASGSVQLNSSPSQCHAPHPCASAGVSTPAFDGLSPDGRRAWFTTTQPLIDSDADEGGDLYLAKLGEEGGLTELVQASRGEAGPSHPTPGAGAGVLGAIRVSADGSHVAFVATGVLTEAENPATHRSAVQSADNLYVYDAETEQIRFVADLCSASGKSGSFADPACTGVAGESPWHLGNPAGEFFKFTPDGRYLLFPAHGRLTADDTDDVSDLYRYDSQTGHLIRLSFGRAGNDADGNDNAYTANSTNESGERGANPLGEDSSRAISADGSTVIFETSAPLVSHDTNAANDVYEWEEAGHGSCVEGEDGSGGCIRLVSDGVDPHGIEFAVIGASGRDITFHTHRGEVPWDSDGVGDLYDARINGGFPHPEELEICHGENCHPAPTPPPSPPNIGTPNFVSPPSGPFPLQCAKGRHRVKKHGQVRCVPKHHKRHRHQANHQRPANANPGGHR